MKFAAALAASTAVLALTTVPAFAGETMTMTSMMVADIGHDVTAFEEHKHVDAMIVRAVPAEWPVLESITRTGGTTLVKISLDAKGALTKATVLKSSGRPRLDESALAAVSATKYAPASFDGKPVPGEYAVTVTFDAAE